MAHPIHTIGHSTRLLDEFVGLLESCEIRLLIDVRTVPKSRHVPHFNTERLAGVLPERGIEYRHLKKLGGLRKPRPESPNAGWRNTSFRGFADFMQTQEFEEGMLDLLNLAARKRAALMCAEALPWRCHRSLIADALVAREMEVRHIISRTDVKVHELTPFAVVKGRSITYPKAKTERDPPRGS